VKQPLVLVGGSASLKAYLTGTVLQALARYDHAVKGGKANGHLGAGGAIWSELQVCGRV